MIALVDMTGGEEWLELVRIALEAGLEGLPPHTMFGLITFSQRVSVLHSAHALYNLYKCIWPVLGILANAFSVPRLTVGWEHSSGLAFWVVCSIYGRFEYGSRSLVGSLIRDFAAGVPT